MINKTDFTPSNIWLQILIQLLIPRYDLASLPLLPLIIFVEIKTGLLLPNSSQIWELEYSSLYPFTSYDITVLYNK